MADALIPIDNDISDVFMGFPDLPSIELDDLDQFEDIDFEDMNAENSTTEEATSSHNSLSMTPPSFDQLSPEYFYSEFKDIIRFNFDFTDDIVQGSLSDLSASSTSISSNETEENKIKKILKAIKIKAAENDTQSKHKVSSLNYRQIGYLALLNSPKNEALLEEIYEFMIDCVYWRQSIRQALSSTDFFKKYKITRPSNIVFSFTNTAAKEILKESVKKTIEECGTKSLGLRNYDLLNYILDGTAVVPKSENRKDNKENRKKEEKPCLDYNQLIFFALNNSPNKSARPLEIYQFIKSHFRYYSEAGEAWHGSVRNALTRKQLFKSIEMKYVNHRSYCFASGITSERLKKSVELIVENKGVEALKLKNKHLYYYLINGIARVH